MIYLKILGKITRVCLKNANKKKNWRKTLGTNKFFANFSLKYHENIYLLARFFFFKTMPILALLIVAVLTSCSFNLSNSETQSGAIRDDASPAKQNRDTQNTKQKNDDTQNTEANIIGYWHGSHSVGAGHGTLYSFFEDGTYILHRPDGEGFDRDIKTFGYWKIEKNELTLSPIKFLRIEGGVTVAGYASAVYPVEGGKYQIIILDEPEETYTGNVDIYSNGSGSKLWSWGDTPLYSFYYPEVIEFTNNAFLESETTEEYYALVGYEEPTTTEYSDDFFVNYLTNEIARYNYGNQTWVSETEEFIFKGDRTNSFSFEFREYANNDHSSYEYIVFASSGRWWVEKGVLYVTAN